MLIVLTSKLNGPGSEILVPSGIVRSSSALDLLKGCDVNPLASPCLCWTAVIMILMIQMFSLLTAVKKTNCLWFVDVVVHDLDRAPLRGNIECVIKRASVSRTNCTLFSDVCFSSVRPRC